MARMKNTNVEETDITPPENIEATELAPGQLSIAERLAMIIDPDDLNEAFCRIYRLSGNPRQPTREFIERVDGILVDDEYLAENYGGGSYFVRYVYKENGVLKNTSGNFNIAESYRGKSGAGASLSGRAENPLASFMQGLTVEKVLALMGAFKELRETLAPPKPQVDMTELLKAVLTNKQQPMSDAVLIEALRGANRQQPKPQNLLEQVRELQQVKELIKDEPRTVREDEDDEDAEEKGGPMDILIKTALGMLPAFLQQNNNNFEATGAQFRDNAYIKNLLVKNPQLANDFVDAARQEYGDSNAQQLARGFGLNVEYVEPAPENPEQLTQENAQVTGA